MNMSEARRKAQEMIDKAVEEVDSYDLDHDEISDMAREFVAYAISDGKPNRAGYMAHAIARERRAARERLAAKVETRDIPDAQSMHEMDRIHDSLINLDCRVGDELHRADLIYEIALNSIGSRDRHAAPSPAHQIADAIASAVVDKLRQEAPAMFRIEDNQQAIVVQAGSMLHPVVQTLEDMDYVAAMTAIDMIHAVEETLDDDGNSTEETRAIGKLAKIMEDVPPSLIVQAWESSGKESPASTKRIVPGGALVFHQEHSAFQAARALADAVISPGVTEVAATWINQVNKSAQRNGESTPEIVALAELSKIIDQTDPESFLNAYKASIKPKPFWHWDDRPNLSLLVGPDGMVAATLCVTADRQGNHVWHVLCPGGTHHDWGWRKSIPESKLEAVDFSRDAGHDIPTDF